MFGEIFGCRAGLEHTLPRFPPRLLGLTILPFPLDKLPSAWVPPIGLLHCSPAFILELEEPVLTVGADCSSSLGFKVSSLVPISFMTRSTSPFRNSDVSIAIGGISSVGRLVFCSFINDAGVAGAPEALPFPSVNIGDRGARGGGGMSTSGSGSGDTDSFDDVSRLVWNVGKSCFCGVCREPGVRGCCINAAVSSRVGARGGGAFFLCGFILGDSRTTRAGFRDVVDFRRLGFVFLLMVGESLGSMGEVDCE